MPMFASLRTVVPLLFVASLARPVMGQEPWEFRPLVASAPIRVVSAKEYAAEAKAAWELISDKTVEAALDGFIHRYSTSDEAALAYAIRFERVRAARSIDGYNRFIAEHPLRLGTRVAVSELFQLYRGEDRLSGYLDFVGRYPGTPEAVAARLHGEQLAFEFATLLQTVEACDGFMLAFADAAQVPAASELARKRLLAEHEAAYAEAARTLSGAELDAWVERKLRSMRFVYRDLWQAIDTEQPTSLTLEFLERQVLGYRPAELDPALRLNLADRMDRLYYVLRWFEPYRVSSAAEAMLAEVRHQELLDKLEEIRAAIDRNSAAMIEALRQEMRESRRVMRESIDRLISEHRLDRAALASGVARLEGAMQTLHEDLGAVYLELRSMHGTLADIEAGVRETNARLARLDERMYTMHASLVALHEDMNRGFSAVAERIEVLNADMNEGFARQWAIAEAQLRVAEESLYVQQETLDVAYESLDVQYESLGLQYEQVYLQAETLSAVEYGFDRLDHTMQVGFTRLEDATWGAASMVAESNRRMIASVQRQQRTGSGGGGGFFKTALGMAGAFVPGVGPVLGTVAGTVMGDTLDKAIAGERIDPLDLGRTALTAGVGAKFGAKYPGAEQAAGLVYDGAVTQRRGGYEQAAMVFGSGVDRASQEAWRSISREAQGTSDFGRVAETMGRQLNVPAEAIRFAVERIF